MTRLNNTAYQKKKYNCMESGSLESILIKTTLQFLVPCGGDKRLAMLTSISLIILRPSGENNVLFVRAVLPIARFLYARLKQEERVNEL